MKKKLFLTLFILVLLIGGGIIYLNNVVLPVKIKSLIISRLQEATKKKVSLQSLQFHIFKGLVLRNLIIYDDNKTFLSLKDGSCAFLIPPIFQRRIISSSLRLKSPEIFLEGRKDGTFNIQDLFPEKAKQEAKADFSVSVYKVRLTNGNIHFQDDAFPEPFTKDIKISHLNIYLSLPASVKLDLKAEIPAVPPVNINATGEFKIPAQELTAKISIQGLLPKEFSAYYQNWGINITEGLIDSLINLKFKDSVLYADLEAQAKNLTISKEKIQALLNADIKANIQYGFKDKQLGVSGKAAITDSQVLGLEPAGDINNINGEVLFNNSGLTADKLRADIWGMPLAAKINLNNFNQPLLNMNITSSLSMASLQGILKDKFKFSFPGDIKGEGNLSLGIQTAIPAIGDFQINGYLDILNAIVHLEKVSAPLEDIQGRLEFNQSQVKWQDLNFKYQGALYKTGGLLTNFQSPGVQLELSSKDLYLNSIFAINNKLIRLSKLEGKYYNCEFSVTGDLDTTDPARLNADIKGGLNINLEDIKEPLKKFYPKMFDGKDLWERINPRGALRAQFNLTGNINDIKSCAITAKAYGSPISIYGLKAQEFLMNYNQIDGIADIPLLTLSLYDGTIALSAKLNLNSDNLPFWVAADIQGVKLEKLKADTAAKEKDIAGTLSAGVKINGFSNDLSKLSGAGKIYISEGKLWQLNLFKGLGALLFAKDFSQIIFSEGSCTFSIQDKYIFSDNLRLKSNIADLTGSAKIGFDSSIDASLNIQVLDEMVPLSGTFKDITTAIIGEAGRVGVIKISGTLKEPKYKFQAAVVDIIKGLKDAIFGK